jgi:N-acetylmuramoyl-L-alanine amidase
MVILIDNGHGSNTGGKCSPDGKLREYAWARDIAKRIEAALKMKGYEVKRIVPEETDIPLSVRCRRVNAVCKDKGAKNCLLISIHINAAKSDGKWHDASGWTGWIAPNASANSKRLAQTLYKEAEKHNLKGNRFVPPCKYFTGNFAIVRDTNCPAVLTENLFQDNRDEVAYLMSEQGKQTIVQLHVDGIVNYIKGV